MRGAWYVMRVRVHGKVVKKKRCERGNNKKLNLRLRVDPYGEIQ